MSRPCASVPNHHFQPGGSSALSRFASITGSVCASQPANRPTSTASANSAPPTTRLKRNFTGRPLSDAHSSVFDPGIDHAIKHINQHVDDEEEQHGGQDRALYRGDVTL